MNWLNIIFAHAREFHRELYHSIYDIIIYVLTEWGDSKVICQKKLYQCTEEHPIMAILTAATAVVVTEAVANSTDQYEH